MTGTPRGLTTVADRVTARIARQAAVEATAPLGGQVLSSSACRTGRSVEVTVDVGLPLSTPADVDRMARLHGHLVDRTEQLTGQVVAPARIRVRALGVDPTRGQPPPDAGPAPIIARRSWSRRRTATACLALALTALCGVLLWTVLSQRFPGMAPLPCPGAECPARGTGRPPVLRRAAALAAAAAGGWLILLAATPGGHRTLALGCASPARARTTRASAARLVRGALADVSGLRVRGVRFTPRRVTVRADVLFGSPEDVRQRAVGVVAATVASLSPGRGPVIRLRLEAHGDRRTGKDAHA
ncbi:hypothetical protein SNE510_58520 [Streptomyces sp. NE5-10]|uniref:DUF6286 domain-containing Asp23/Gls24 family envelope stress response protein n=1 Tax=Streptomyces sp. NE5-10 TaxID=2759674 RepID=UPI0019089D45|nr:DUF6286 domain-containing protein [Streptomyces sp. NE5-10]GHJ96333.1 hypothetical protein SNE510_58520 [Streptomyces sp. NE5-10]